MRNRRTVPLIAVTFSILVIAATKAQTNQTPARKPDTSLQQLLAAAAHSFAAVKGEAMENMMDSYRSKVEVPGTTGSYLEFSDTVHPYYVACIARKVNRKAAMEVLERWKKKVAAAAPTLVCSRAKTGDRYLFTDADEMGEHPSIYLSASQPDSDTTTWNVRLFINHDL